MIKKILGSLICLCIGFTHAQAELAERHFTSDWFSNNIPDWDKYKPMFYNKDNMHCLEIGSWEGRSTLYIVENYCNGEGSQVDSVDTWQGSMEHAKLDTTGIYDRFKINLKQYLDNNQVLPHKGFSSDILMAFVQEMRKGERNKYDFIYIDGSHVAKDVLLDAVLSWELLKIGGILIFDDYEWINSSPTLTPKPAIDGFMHSYESMYKILLKKYQIHLEKISDNPSDNPIDQGH